MDPTRKFQPSDLTMSPNDLASLLAEPLPAHGPIAASAGEWRLADGLWHFWQAQEWIDD